ncbi:hypothetical protein FB45DRAFT_1036681 [Roridomyces roridus]|uniref:Uncharacterized protein n=1 Tax=Roridomyces roridus TaxID=1738132 RepID=A0AAD7B7P3_9AGAR|nr:hypothetical protein FB45DRAFT_1036681 [Roridomyces roridus]
MDDPTTVLPTEEDPLFYDLPEDGSYPEDSDDDSDYDPNIDTAAESDVEDEMPDTQPSFFVNNTQRLRASVGNDLCKKVQAVLASMDAVGIDLPIFLDALSWGDADCIGNGKVRNEYRVELENKGLRRVKLPGIWLLAKFLRKCCPHGLTCRIGVIG